MFALEEELAAWDAELAQLRGPARLDRLLGLAWHLRQRDPARARALAQEAAPLAALLPESGRRGAEARLLLVEGEAAFLFCQLDAAHDLATRALAASAAMQDAAGSADAHWLHAWIEVDRGNPAASDAALAAAADCARRAGDPVRLDVFDACAALFAVFRDVQSADAG